MSKAIQVCVLLFASLMSGLTSAAADVIAAPSGVVSKVDEARELANAACLQAIDLVMRHYGDEDGKPLSAMAMALVRRCNGHPVLAICDMSSHKRCCGNMEKPRLPAGPMPPILFP
jgi:hypothetical protein